MRNPPEGCPTPREDWRAGSCPGKKHDTALGLCCDRCGISVEDPPIEEKEEPIPVAPGQVKLFGDFGCSRG